MMSDPALIWFIPLLIWSSLLVVTCGGIKNNLETSQNLQNRFLAVSTGITAYAAHPLNGSIMAGTKEYLKDEMNNSANTQYLHRHLASYLRPPFGNIRASISSLMVISDWKPLFYEVMLRADEIFNCLLYCLKACMQKEWSMTPFAIDNV